MKWHEAVTEYNKKHNNGKYCFYKRGSKEYEEIRANYLASNPAKAEKVKKVRVPKEKKVRVPKEKKEKAPRKPRAKKADAVPVADAIASAVEAVKSAPKTEEVKKEVKKAVARVRRKKAVAKAEEVKKYDENSTMDDNPHKGQGRNAEFNWEFCRKILENMKDYYPKMWPKMSTKDRKQAYYEIRHLKFCEETENFENPYKTIESIPEVMRKGFKAYLKKLKISFDTSAKAIEPKVKKARKPRVAKSSDSKPEGAPVVKIKKDKKPSATASSPSNEVKMVKNTMEVGYKEPEPVASKPSAPELSAPIEAPIKVKVPRKPRAKKEVVVAPPADSVA